MTMMTMIIMMTMQIYTINLPDPVTLGEITSDAELLQ